MREKKDVESLTLSIFRILSPLTAKSTSLRVIFPLIFLSKVENEMEISSPSARRSKAEETISSVADFAEKRKIEESEMKAKAKTIISERITILIGEWYFILLPI